MVKAPILAKIQNIFQSDTMLFRVFFPHLGRFYGISSTKLQFFRKFLQKSLEVIKKCVDLGVEVAIVVGGGNSAVSDALYLSHLCKKVYLVHRRDVLRATKIYHEPVMKAENIEFCYNSVVSKVESEDGRVSSISLIDVKTNEKREIECDAVFISIGRKPATEFLDGQLELDRLGYIVADESTKTNIPGVFAAGDIRVKSLRQVVTAAADGAIAAMQAEKYLAEME